MLSNDKMWSSKTNTQKSQNQALTFLHHPVYINGTLHKIIINMEERHSEKSTIHLIF